MKQSQVFIMLNFVFLQFSNIMGQNLAVDQAAIANKVNGGPGPSVEVLALRAVPVVSKIAAAQSGVENEAVLGQELIIDSGSFSLTGTSLSLLGDVSVTGPVHLVIPTGATFTINGSNYVSGSITGLTFAASNVANTYSCVGDISVTNGTASINSLANLSVQGVVTFDGNSAGIFSIDSNCELHARGNISIINQQGIDLTAVTIAGLIQSDNSITISDNHGSNSSSSQSYGVQIPTGGQVLAGAVVTMNNNSGLTFDASVYGVYNDGLIQSDSIIVQSNFASAGSSFFSPIIICGVYNNGTMQATSGLDLSNNTGQVVTPGSLVIAAYGFYNGSSVTVDQGNIVLNSNRGLGAGSGLYNISLSSITISSSGNLYMNNNQGSGSVGAILNQGVYLNGTLSIAGDVFVNSNSSTATNYDSGVYIDGSCSITAVNMTMSENSSEDGGVIILTNNPVTLSGNLTMNQNSGGVNIQSGLFFIAGNMTMNDNNGGTQDGVAIQTSSPVVAVTGNIIMEHNRSDSSNGVFLNASTVKTNGVFVINVLSGGRQVFNANGSNPVTITDSSDTALLFNGFTVTVDGVVRTTYAGIPGGSVQLATANRS